MSLTESSRSSPLSRFRKVLPYPDDPRTFGAITTKPISRTRNCVNGEKVGTACDSGPPWMSMITGRGPEKFAPADGPMEGR